MSPKSSLLMCRAFSVPPIAQRQAEALAIVQQARQKEQKVPIQIQGPRESMYKRRPKAR